MRAKKANGRASDLELQSVFLVILAHSEKEAEREMGKENDLYDFLMNVSGQWSFQNPSQTCHAEER